MRLSVPLLLVLVAVTALYLLFGEDGGAGTAGVPAPAREPASPEVAPDTGLPDAVPRDELGAVIPSDPASDLPGIEPGPDPPVVLPKEVGEREVHLLELYGQQSVEELRAEREVLRQRFETELALALDEAFERGEGIDEVAGEGPRHTASGDPLLAETRTRTEPATGVTVARRVTLATEDHPHLYELRDTLEWLDARIGD